MLPELTSCNASKAKEAAGHAELAGLRTQQVLQGRNKVRSKHTEAGCLPVFAEQMWNRLCEYEQLQFTKSIINSLISNISVGIVFNTLDVAHCGCDSSRLARQLVQLSAVAARGWVDSPCVGA